MNSLREWAEFYSRFDIAVYPSDLKLWAYSYPWKQSLEDVQKYEWEDSKEIAGIAKVNDIVIIRLCFNDKEDDYIFKVVTRCMALFGKHHYPWIIQDYKTIDIVIRYMLGDKFYIQGFDSISIEWEGSFLLPFKTDKLCSSVDFFFNGIPMMPPSFINQKELQYVIKHLIDEFGLFLDRGY